MGNCSACHHESNKHVLERDDAGLIVGGECVICSASGIGEFCEAMQRQVEAAGLLNGFVIQEDFSRCPGCGAEGCKGECVADLMEDIEVLHLRKPDGSCVISLNGQGHLPCTEH